MWQADHVRSSGNRAASTLIHLQIVSHDCFPKWASVRTRRVWLGCCWPYCTASVTECRPRSTAVNLDDTTRSVVRATGRCYFEAVFMVGMDRKICRIVAFSSTFGTLAPTFGGKRSEENEGRQFLSRCAAPYASLDVVNVVPLCIIHRSWWRIFTYRPI